MKILTAFAVYCLLCQGCVSTTNSSIPLQSDADAAVANLNLGLAHQQGNFLQARAFMQRSLASGADSPEMLWLCIQIEGQLSSPTQAQACATRLKGQFPEPVQASQLFELERDAA